ncbi:MAG: hybrid sensor histidine kinase/response regulator [Sphingobacteriaceae bacterium]|nr:MAG: hybrid sensor histidine kinase/response regulator [Sphingobacteriaceae bacterium]
MFKYILWLVFSVACCSGLYAQNNEYQFSQLDITNGLANNRVNCIYKDAQGFMWFGTTSGLSRFDGYEFKNFKHNAADPQSLYSNYVEKIEEGPENKLWIYTNNGISIYDPQVEKFSDTVFTRLKKYGITTKHLKSIKKDAAGNYWFLVDEGVYQYNLKTKQTRFFNADKSSEIVLHTNNVTEILGDKNSIVRLIYSDGTIDQLDIKSGKILNRNKLLYEANLGKNLSYLATMDAGGKLWIHVSENPIGVFCFDPKAGKLTHLQKGTPGISLNSNLINSIVPGENNTVWIGTDHGGINVVNTLTNHYTYLVNRADDLKSLRGNSVVLYKDNSGIIWAGTTKQGVSYYHKGIIQFPQVRHYIFDAGSLPYEDVDCFAEDAQGNFWIGTNGGGLLFYNHQTKKYTQFKHDAANANSLSNDIVISLRIDHNQKLWIGTYFGGLDRLENGRFVHYRHQDNVPGSLSDDRVFTLMEDAENRLWAGTFSGGLNIFNPKTNQFDHPEYPSVSNYTGVIFEDKQHNIWIGRDKGIDVIQKNGGRIKHYIYQYKNSNTLVANDVNCIIQDHNGLIWIGTKEGISILNPQNDQFINIQEKQGLPSNNVLSMIEDNRGRVWMSTANGIASVQLSKNKSGYSYQIHNYNGFDGLQGNEFNANAAYKCKNGDLIFGGAQGFNLFKPDLISSSGVKLNLVFTDFQLFNKSVEVGDTLSKKVLLKEAISKTRSITLNHNENVFSIAFAALNFYNPDKIIYQYKLEGFDKQWLTALNNSRKATYTNLDAGDYVFKVKATDRNLPTNVSTINLQITVLPPFWKSPLAYFLYILAGIGLLFYIRHRGILKLKREFKNSQQKLEAEREAASQMEAAKRMHELDLMKIRFFTNVSHEFRTPLSLITSPIDTLIKNNQNPEQNNQLLMIRRNSRRLLNLVNQLLDFRKMESNELKLNLEKGDIIFFIKEVSASFNDLAEQKKISYLVESEIDKAFTKFDYDKIERILFNLISNAFKFTPAGGQISVRLKLADKNSIGLQPENMLEIKIADTGIGIPKEKLQSVFERFYQVDMPAGLLNQGSGIGLSISSEFVKMHSGELYAESEPGNGSCFTIKLPIRLEADFVNDAPPAVHQPETILKPVATSAENRKKQTVLIVDDNDDLRFYLKDNLKTTFNILEAVNGKEGWQKALALHPDLIVSDVNMPEMNGLDLCKKIKTDNRTSHIPLILLTALTQEEDQLSGLTNGANDYISKPFNFEILLSKINGLLQMQESFKKTYQKQREIKVQDLEIVSEDEKFLKRVFDCIEANITNYNFSVEELSRQMSLSRVSLYKRMLALTGKTPVDCIRTVRLKRAVQLLEKSKLSIASIAYEVGFNNPTYFSKVFKDEYGVVPSEYFNQPDKKKLQSTTDR